MADRALDVLYPLGRVALGVFGEVEGHNLVLEHLVDGGGVELVLLGLVGVGTLVGEGPSGLLVEAVAFVPPAVEDAEVEHAVHLGLLARCAGGLEGTCGGVEPNVNAGNEALGDNHVVVLQEDDLAQELGHARDFDDALDEALAGAVGGVGLAREDELHGELLVVDDACETVKVGEEEVCALVGCEAACETDDEGVGVNLLDDVHHLAGVALVGEPLGLEVALDKVDELVLEGHAHVPDLLVRDLEDVVPGLGVALVVEDVLAEFLLVEGLPLAGGPGGHVHAVGDVADVALFPRVAFPYTGEHLL